VASSPPLNWITIFEIFEWQLKEFLKLINVQGHRLYHKVKLTFWGEADKGAGAED
jgi:hypothetical protein